MPTTLFSLIITLLAIGGFVQAFIAYPNDFVDPDLIVNGKFPDNTLAARVAILQWANDSASGGPWSVINKKVPAPSGDIHDYMSWAPYWWPDCSKVGNKTELTPEEVWKTCPYHQRDGEFNPDRLLVNDVENFYFLSDAVLYNSIAFALTGSTSSSYSQTTVNYIRTWFLDDATKMNPNLNYGQMQRGPGGQKGSHTGLLDLKGMTKVLTAVEILRKTKCTDWTTDLDNKMVAWAKEYITWAESSPISLEEEAAENNHGTFFYNQLAALKILVGDRAGALKVTQKYFSTQFMTQITAGGEQPLEAARTHPYHYHAYNLAAIITNARLSTYLGDSSVWNKTTNEGATIKDAVDFAMTLSAAKSHEEGGVAELYPIIAAVAAVYGDPDGKYVSFLQKADPTYAEEAHFIWSQPLTGGEAESAALAKISGTDTAEGAKPTGKTSNNNKDNGAAFPAVNFGLGACVLAVLQFTFVL